MGAGGSTYFWLGASADADPALVDAVVLRLAYELDDYDVAFSGAVIPGERARGLTDDIFDILDGR